MLSDERVKEDVQEVGQLHDGQRVVSYRYKGEPETQIGLLAQDVMKHESEAVRQRADGLLAVDYDRATRRAAQEEPRRRAGARR